MSRMSPKYDPINREEIDKRENWIRPPKNTQVIEKMYNDFVEGIKKLEKDMAKGKKDEDLALTRKRLGEKGWSLQHLYGYKIKEAKMKELGVVLSVGKIIPKGKSSSR